MRIGEAIELRWRDVDLGERIVHVRRRFHAGRVGSRFSCPVGRQTRVRMGVRACLHDLQLVAVCFSINSRSLQAVSAENSLLPRFRADF